MAIKDDIIRVRVSKEQKEFFKRIAKRKKVSMSEFMVVATEERALKEQEKLENKESLEQRVAEFEKKLQDALLISMKHYDNKYKSIKYSYKNNIYNIEFRSIIKIEKESDSKRCIIYTEDGNYPIQGTVDEILSLLDNRFFKCNRAVIINVEQVKRYNNSKNIAILKNGEEFKDISRNKKKEMAKRVRGIS